jgi:glycosyltransferase involved in cell wall biosynthesis
MRYIHQMLVSSELGGAGIIGIHLANFLRAEGREYCLWVPGEGSALRKIRQLALKFNRYDAASVVNPSIIREIRGNWKIWQSFHPYGRGIIHIHSPYHYKAFRMGLQKSGLKTIVHIHIHEPEEALRWTFKRPPDIIITCARMFAEQVRYALPRKYQENQKIFSVPNAVDINRFFPGDKFLFKQRVGAHQSTPLVLMVANLAQHKGQETAIRATALLKSVGVNITCWFAGVERESKSWYTTRLQNLCNELGVGDRVRFLGHRDDVPDLLRATDVFILPSACEGLPLSILEAQATKVPVLAAPTAGIPEVVTDKETGFLIPAEDIDGYAYHIQDLLRHPDTSHYIREQAYKRIMRQHKWKDYCEHLSSIYESST